MAKRTHELDEAFFSNITTEKQAYVLGMLISDGAIDEKRYSVKIDLADKDEEILHKIKDALSYSGPVRQYTRKTGDTYVSLRVCSKEMVGDLVRIGVTTRKSFTCKLPHLQDKVLRHFLRGLYDGDGSVTWSKRNTKLYPRYVLYGNEELLLAVKYVYEEIFEIDFPNVRPHSSISRFDVSGKKACQVMDWVYKDAEIYLDRKYERWKILSNEQNEYARTKELSK